MAESEKSIVKTALLITVIAAVSKVLGFLREMAIAYVYGVGAVTDAYAVAARIVGTAGLLVSTYLTTTFVPAYIREKEEKSEEDALQFTNDVTGLSLAINIALMIIMQIAAPLILKLTGFAPEQSSFAMTAVRISLFQLPLSVFISLFTGYLTARKSFFGPNFIGIPLNIVIIAVCIIMGTQSGVTGLALANLLGAAAQFFILLFWLPKEKYRYKFSVRFNTPEIRKGVKLLLPVLLGSTVYDLNVWVDTVISTYLGEGSTAAIGFASRLLGSLQGLIILPVAGVIYSYMSEYAAKKEADKMLDTLWRTVRVVLFIVVPIIVIAMPSGRDIIQIVYQRGQFTHEATLLTGSALIWYMPGLVGTAVQIFLFRLFYVLQDTKTPMLCGIASVTVNIALSITLSSFMGVAGVALATSIGSALSAPLLLILLRRKMGQLGFGKTAVDILKMLLCAVPCGLAILGARYLLSGQSALIRFAAGACAAGAAYLILAFFLREMALMDLLNMLRERIKKR